jgi:NAD(P)H-dependent flavin oxidoreductase YrpB (nitropropane dioxygenase family)
MNATSPLRTRICDLFGIRYPIVQTGMGWVSGARLTAATSAAGGLGVLASATMTLPQLEQAIREVRERTDKPFGVNLRTDQEDIDERIALLVRERVRIASFAQAPRKDVVLRLKDAGVLTMPTIGAKRHAEKVAALGVDAIIAQGHEGGGHTGPVPTTLLLPEVTRAVDIPVLGAGGFFDGRGLVAALAYGAAGIAMGTRFLLTRESTVPDAVKKLYLETAVTGTVVTRAIDGYPQRVIRTPFVEALERSRGVLALARAGLHAWQFRSLTGTSMVALFKEGLAMKKAGELTLGQMAMAANAPMLTKASMVDGRPEVGILPTGQVVGTIDELPTVQELVARIVREAEATLARLGVPAARQSNGSTETSSEAGHRS